MASWGRANEPVSISDLLYLEEWRLGIDLGVLASRFFVKSYNCYWHSVTREHGNPEEGWPTF